MRNLSVFILALCSLFQANTILAQAKPDLIILRIEPPLTNYGKFTCWDLYIEANIQLSKDITDYSVQHKNIVVTG